MLSRPYFSYIDDAGKAHKPFVMPQEDPAFYDSFVKLYNLPELVTGPVRPGEQEFAHAVTSLRAVGVKGELPAASATPPAAPDTTSPWRAPLDQPGPTLQ